MIQWKLNKVSYCKTIKCIMRHLVSCHIMMLHVLALLCFFAASTSAQIITNVIPLNNLPATGTFQGIAGVPGGIDQYSTNYTMFCNVRVSIPGTTNIAYGDGIHDDTTAINFAVNAAPNGTYVYIPTGTYLVTSGIARTGNYNYDLVQHSFSIIIRGDGPTNTIILNNAPNGEIIAISSKGSYGGNWPIASGNIRGGTNITIPGALAILTNQWIMVERNDASANVYYPLSSDAHPFYYTYTLAASQLVKVTKVNGTTFSFTPALNEGYTTDLVGVFFSQPLHCGIEDLCVVRLQDVNAHNIRIIGGEECWVKNVESRQARGYHISLEYCGGCEVRGCYIHDPFPFKDGNTGGGGSDYGIVLGFHSSSCLVEDNIALHCRHSFIMETGAGQDNVIAYNYGKDNINEGLFTTDYQMDTMTHGGEPRYNLFEGNVFPILRFDAVEGATKYEVAFRNLITRDGIPTVNVAMNAMDIQRGNYDDYFLDNVYLPCTASPTTPVYRIGSWEDVANSDPSVISNDVWLGNADLSNKSFDHSANGNMFWTNTPPASFPPSLVYASKPSFFGTNVWPAFGSDVAGYTHSIPAQIRAKTMGDFSRVYSDGFILTLTNSAGGTFTAPGNHSYFNSSMIALTAAPDSSHVFANWSGYSVADSNSANTYLIMPASNITIDAAFNPLNQVTNSVMHPPSDFHSL